MLDQQILRNNLDALKDNLERRGLNIDVDFLVQQDEKKRAIKFEAEKARSEQKNIGKEISQSEGTKKEELLKKASLLSENVKLLNEKYETEEKLFLEQWIKIPNLVDETSPTGATDQDNKEIKKVGEIKEIENIKNHLEIGESLNLIDVERAAEVSGSRFSYIFGDLVKIELNLVSWVLEKLSSKEFTPTVPPVLVREEALFGTGFFPDDAEQVYEIPKDDLFLVGTSEVPLAALHANEILDLETLPVRYAGFSTCFRREAGTYGKDTTGIFRVHQFDKVEMFSFCNPEKSKDEHEYLLSIEEEILQELEIPYRVVDVCTGDLGASAAKKYDIEAWIPSQQSYREVTSCSNTTDFQARRLNIRTKIDGNTTTMHTLNGTALAVGRILIALIENNQKTDGSVEFSDSLAKILGVKKLSQK
ncbi:serine--tRNA ligase [Acidimicrobiia bacterium]|nr:serine--tRNA ligase [Acidimicrobiaceae bacterium]MDA9197487.1 serine--tRNA ligase [Acidimicrobiia bacterium]MDB2456045.1 serine--tRNA ligase [Candidatus Actinomarina sp.]MDC3275329.1 serine--tRNA ligase [bacterium]MDC3277490.1 serine--tRNA ligase [Acidimicrobiia bacterium]|tara:strand:- start:1135 stop:2391 length:1257 start_codon:yes stop_codon:yes gene_type:complete